MGSPLLISKMRNTVYLKYDSINGGCYYIQKSPSAYEWYASYSVLYQSADRQVRPTLIEEFPEFEEARELFVTIVSSECKRR